MRMVKFTTDLVVEGIPTSDGRLIDRGACTWKIPATICMMDPTKFSYEISQIVGQLRACWREGDRVLGRGFVDVERRPQLWSLFEDDQVRLGADMKLIDQKVTARQAEPPALWIKAAVILGATLHLGREGDCWPDLRMFQVELPEP